MCGTKEETSIFTHNIPQGVLPMTPPDTTEPNLRMTLHIIWPGLQEIALSQYLGFQEIALAKYLDLQEIALTKYTGLQ